MLGLGPGLRLVGLVSGLGPGLGLGLILGLVLWLWLWLGVGVGLSLRLCLGLGLGLSLELLLGLGLVPLRRAARRPPLHPPHKSQPLPTTAPGCQLSLLVQRPISQHQGQSRVMLPQWTDNQVRLGDQSGSDWLLQRAESARCGRQFKQRF